MRKLIFTAIILVSAFSSLFAQNAQFEKFVENVKQSFDDKGYKLASENIGKAIDTLPLISDTLMLESETYYNVVVASDNCTYCVLKLFFVDSENNMFPLEFEVTETIDGRFNYRIYKDMWKQYEVGRFVVMISSDLPYDMAILVYKKYLP